MKNAKINWLLTVRILLVLVGVTEEVDDSTTAVEIVWRFSRYPRQSADRITPKVIRSRAHLPQLRREFESGHAQLHALPSHIWRYKDAAARRPQHATPLALAATAPRGTSSWRCRRCSSKIKSYG
ncbi:hypothetical protein H4582DRAFT_1972893, partial [Lactarius indigo]